MIASRLLCAAAVLLVACSPSPLGPPSGQTDRTIVAEGPAKSISLGTRDVPAGFGAHNMSWSGGAATVVEIHSNGLVTNDLTGGIEPRLAAKMPSFDDGTTASLPDGRLQDTWKLRPTIRWQDGVPFTAEDMAFAYQVLSHPDSPWGRSEIFLRIDGVEAIDPHTLRITWKTTFFKHLELGVREFWPYPKHLLAEPFQGDKSAFHELPYFGKEYMHLGPFRLADYGSGETQIFERFDDYFLGRPKVNRIILKAFGEPNTLLAAFLAGEVDVASERALTLDMFAQLREQWSRSGTGTVVGRQDNWRHLFVQFNPQLASPAELSRDVRVRRGLLYAIDRDAIREHVLPGFEDTSADTFMGKGDPRANSVGAPFARYLYDPTRATQELSDAGWRRAADGRLLNPAGELIQIGIRGEQAETKEVSIIADFWRRLGIDATEDIIATARARDGEYKNAFPGTWFTSRSQGADVLTFFDSRQAPTPQNRYTGLAAGSYSNPAFDQLVDKLYGTLSERDQGMILKDAGSILAEDLPALPVYFRVVMSGVRKGVRALVDDYQGAQLSTANGRNAHLWDRE
jgi:peptide/nickel transport system substrate-binding protein